MFGLFMEKVINDKQYSQYWEDRFPRFLRGLKNRPYGCHTPYVPKVDTTAVDSIAIHTDGIDEEEEVVLPPVIEKK